MKSYFFGLNAKVALALLAISGTVLTGCYEKEDGDVAVPVIQPNPEYYIKGTVTNIETGNVEGGVSVKISIGSKVDNQTTDANGNYESANLETSGTATVEFTKTGFDPVSKTQAIAAAGKGDKATYLVSAVITPTGYTPPVPPVPAKEFSVTAETEAYGSYVNKITSGDDVTVDIINNGSSTIKVDFVITHYFGSVFADGIQLDGIDEEFKGKIKDFLSAVYGQGELPTEYPTVDTNYSVYVGSMWALESITATTNINKTTYEFTYGDDIHNVIVYTAYNCDITNEQVQKGHGTGHGHGHGGGSLNAGGGIFEGI